MCGIAGLVVLRSRESAAALRATARRMSAALLHRGPDDGGEWADADAGVAFGHRRLSIVDLSPHGHQPMMSACGRYVIVFNGEIYNHREIRSELDRLHSAVAAVSVGTEAQAEPNVGARIAWRGHCDTEVMLAAIARLGRLEALKRFVGMFAFALWDRHDARAAPRARPDRREAAVLRLDGRHAAVRLRTEGAARAPCVARRLDRGCARVVHAPRLRAGAVFDLPRRRKLLPGTVRHHPRRIALRRRDPCRRRTGRRATCAERRVAAPFSGTGKRPVEAARRACCAKPSRAR